ncbi:MAG: hypothetical protein VX293_12630 [Candidatus Latescibacterota bacterium]|nr:hypothetical protein [Candidatus Latescibacterota bacterium]
MTSAQNQIAARLEGDFAAGQLSADGLRAALEALLQDTARRQDLLYLHATSTAPSASVVAMTLVEGGAIVAPPDDPDDWPYQSALDAINDGWRVISFPNMALLALSADDPHGLGFEFILEKWS